MNKIKYRAWKKTNTPELFTDIKVIDWIKNVIKIKYQSGNKFRIDTERLSNVTLMQYTGLNDKNSIEIYQGDIVKPERGKPFVVNHFIFGQGIIEKAIITSGGHGFDGIYHGSEVEVIGNIHENPELLEGVK